MIRAENPTMGTALYPQLIRFCGQSPQGSWKRRLSATLWAIYLFYPPCANKKSPLVSLVQDVAVSAQTGKRKTRFLHFFLVQ
jgi:hypothetical protein